MKHQTSISRLLLLLAAVVLTWGACHEPEIPLCRIEGALHHIIPDSTAAKYQHRFIKAYDTLKKIAPDTFLARHFRIPNAETFSREALCVLINHPGVDSVRIFYGEDTTGSFRLILKGVDKKGQLVITKLLPGKNYSDSAAGDALENGQTCPPCMVPFN